MDVGKWIDSNSKRFAAVILKMVFHGFPDQAEIICFTSAGAASYHTNINVCLTVAVVFKILRLSLRTLRYNQSDRLYFSASLSTLFNFSTCILQPSLDKGDRTITANQIALLHLSILADGKIVKGEQIGSRCLLVFFGKPNLISPQYIQVKKIGVV